MYHIKNKGFTLIELLIVIAIIGILASVVLASLNAARTKSRDTKRLAEMKQVQIALEMQFHEDGQYPTSDTDGCGSWDVGNQDYQFMTNKLPEAMPNPPNDATATGSCTGYRYYRYAAGSYGCDASLGAYYVLGVVNMETSGNPHPESPGWSCSGRNWQGEMEWVTGKFEKE